MDGKLIRLPCKAEGDVFQEASDITIAYFTFHHIENNVSLRPFDV